ncbi:MAG: hypothetical protein VX408_06795 [Pseudomonadota bacterium]|nr:hypothetical protein [Pseudomonadota bacterium]MED6317171.1 hypothetical protein [Pseudomonadota bacterium]
MNNNESILSDIKAMQLDGKNHAVINSIKQTQAKMTPLAHLYNGKTWNTTLPSEDAPDVFLLMDTAKGRVVISGGHISYLNSNGALRVQDRACDWLYEAKLIAWMSKSKAMLLLDCHE